MQVVAVHRGSDDRLHLCTEGDPCCVLRGVALACRRAIPLALALLNVSSPTLGAMDALSRLSHDTDTEVAQNAVVALGGLPAAMHAPADNPAARVMHSAVATGRFLECALGHCIDKLQRMCIGCKLLLYGLPGKACTLCLCNEAESGHMLPVWMRRGGVAG